MNGWLFWFALIANALIIWRVIRLAQHCLKLRDEILKGYRREYVLLNRLINSNRMNKDFLSMISRAEMSKDGHARVHWHPNEIRTYYDVYEKSEQTIKDTLKELNE